MVMALDANDVVATADSLKALALSYESTERDLRKQRDTRQDIVMQAKNLINIIRDPMDGCMELVNNRSDAQLHTLGALRACLEIGIFEYVPKEGAIPLKALSEKSGADGSLITRLMRQLTSNGIFIEVTLGEWKHNSQSRIYCDRDEPADWYIRVCVDEMGGGILILSEYLAQHGFKDVTTYNDTPYSWFHREQGMSFFEVLSKYPDRMEAFSRGLSLWETAHPTLGIYPFETLLRGNSPDRPLMVDVGGGRGRSLLTVRSAHPDLKGEMILQDQDDVLSAISPFELPRVTKMPHDFFMPNPVHNAQVYWIRRVLHDWQDSEARSIIEAIIPAMAHDSRILISDFLIQEPVTVEDCNANWLDLMMMTIGGKERTEKDYEILCEGTPVEVVKIWRTDKTRSCVVEIMRRDRDDLRAQEAVFSPTADPAPMRDEELHTGSLIAEEVQANGQPPKRIKVGRFWYQLAAQKENGEVPNGPPTVSNVATLP